MFKIISLKCSWIKRLYDSITYDLKLIPLHIITQKLGKHFSFYSDLYIDPKKIRQFPKYYQEIFGSKWNSKLSVMPKTSSTTGSQIIWYNKHILVDKRSFYNTTLADKRINHVGQLLDANGAMKSLSVFKREFGLKQSSYYWIQLNNAIPKAWKENIYKVDENCHDLTFSGHHILKKYQIYSLSKFNSKELYSLQVSLNDSETISQIYFEKPFSKQSDLMEMYILYATS